MAETLALDLKCFGICYDWNLAGPPHSPAVDLLMVDLLLVCMRIKDCLSSLLVLLFLGSWLMAIQ